MPPTRTQTSVGIETVDETVSRAQAMVAPSTNVPVAAIENNAPPALNIPQPTVPQVDASAALATSDQLTGSIQEQNLQQEQARAAQAGTRLSDSERAIREAVGIIGTEGQARTQLEESAGMTQMKQQLNQLSNQLFNQTAALRQFDTNNVNTIEQMRVDASRNDITKRTFNAQSAEAGIQMAVQRANMVGELYATQSSVQLLQGNIQMAAESIDKALQAIYEPKRQELQMEMMFFQRNAQLFDAAENRVANARVEVIRQQQAEIDRAQDMIYNAVQNGYATAEEVQEMVNLETPREQRELAQIITNRGAAQMRGLQMEQIAMNIATSRAQLAKLTQPDANTGLIQSLFAQGQPTQSFQEFLADRGLDNMSLLPERLAELEQEYNESFAVNPEQQQQVLSYLVATGQVSVQQAEFMQSNLRMTTPQQQVKQQMAVTRGKTVLRDVERALSSLKEGTFSTWAKTGASGSVSGFIPGTSAWQLQQHLDSIKSNISIDQLQAMREASPTGGALGQVPVQQQEFLMSVLGSLQRGLQPQDLRENLELVYDVYLDTMFGTPDELSAKVRSGGMTASEANSYLQQRKSTTFDDFSLPRARSSVNGERVDIGDLVIAPNGEIRRIK